MVGTILSCTKAKLRNSMSKKHPVSTKLFLGMEIGYDITLQIINKANTKKEFAKLINKKLKSISHKDKKVLDGIELALINALILKRDDNLKLK